MKKALLAVELSALTLSAAHAADRVGVTIYKYDDNFMSVMRKALEANAFVSRPRACTIGDV